MVTGSILRRLSGWDRLSREQKDFTRYRIGYRVAAILSVIPLPLTVLFRHFGSDKEMAGGHAYGRAYGRTFAGHRFKPVTFLEIGIGGYESRIGGKSLLAWRAYFPRGRIVGCDIVDKSRLQLGRIRVKQLDQSSSIDLNELIREEGPFDIIVDDGSHLSHHQIGTFDVLFDAVKDGGIYVIEDVQTSYWPEKVAGVAWGGAHVSARQFPDTCVGYFLKMAAYLNHAKFTSWDGVDQVLVARARSVRTISFEHNLVIIEKGPNDAPSNLIPVTHGGG